MEGFETQYGESNNYFQTTYDYNGNTVYNASPIYDEYKSTTKNYPLETGFDEYNITESSPIIEESPINETNLDINEYKNDNDFTVNIDMENLTNLIPIEEANETLDTGGYQINEQIIGTSDSMDTFQLATNTPSFDFKEDINSGFYDTNHPLKEIISFNDENIPSSTPLQGTNYSSEGYETTEPYAKDGTTYSNYQTNEIYNETTTSFDDNFQDSKPYLEIGIMADETAYQTTEPYFETSTTLNTTYQISEPSAESTINEVYQAFEPNTESEIEFDNTLYQTTEQEIPKNIDYTSFNVETSQEFDSNIYPSNEPNIGAETIFDENIYQTTEPYIETNEQYDQPSTTSFDTNDFLAKETYTYTTSTILLNNTIMKILLKDMKDLIIPFIKQ